MFAGLFARAVLLKQQMKTKPCQRCGTYYNHSEHDDCPRCTELSDHDVEKILEYKNIGKQGNKMLGIWFLGLALVVGLIVIAVSSF